MPNWTSNSLECKGLLNIIKEKGYGDERTIFSFDKVKPMPKSLEITSGSNNGTALYYYRKRNGEKQARDEWEEQKLARLTLEDKDKLYNAGQILDSNIRNYGCPTWYEWCNRHWGVKWDASDVYEVDDNTIEFETPWGPPTPIYVELSRQNPDVTFHIEFVQEEGGKGIEEYLNGECIHEEWDEDFSWYDEEEEE